MHLYDTNSIIVKSFWLIINVMWRSPWIKSPSSMVHKFAQLTEPYLQMHYRLPKQDVCIKNNVKYKLKSIQQVKQSQGY